MLVYNRLAKVLAICLNKKQQSIQGAAMLRSLPTMYTYLQSLAYGQCHTRALQESSQEACLICLKQLQHRKQILQHNCFGLR